MAPRSRSEAGLLPALLLGATFALGAAPAQADQRLGRLFMTPQERQQLDELRRAEMENPEITLAPARAPEAVPEQDAGPINPITIRGLVTRSDGRSMAWINESNTYEGDLSAEFLRVRPDDIRGGEIRLQTPYGQDAVQLKVGQMLEPSTGRIIDLSERAEQQPRSAPAEDARPDAATAAPAAPARR